MSENAPVTAGGEDHLVVNRDFWDSRAAAHAASPGYAVERFASDPSFLSDVVRFDLPRLGDVAGLTGLHLQCHIGTDTASLARLGATMTGLDLSGASLEQARHVAEVAGVEITYVQGDVYSAPDLVPPASFDLVFTGIGALCWLPDIHRWAQTVAALLRPGGRLFLREGHPVLWALEDGRDDDLLVLGFPYWRQSAPTDWDEPGSYVEVDRPLSHTRSLSWNHGLGDILTALFDAGLPPTAFVEHDSVPWEALPGQMVKAADLDEWSLRSHPERAPMSYTLQAVKRG